MQTHTCESFADARAARYFDLFPSLTGQVTVSVIAPGQISGWHRHRLQTDQWFVAKGRVKICTIDEDGKIDELHVEGPAAKVVTVRPGLWHGWRSFDEEVILIYFLDHKHDETDEIRATAIEIFERYGYQL